MVLMIDVYRRIKSHLRTLENVHKNPNLTP
jgi:hypothetical protein